VDTWEPSWPGRPTGPGSLGRRIAEMRGARGWTQQQLAERLGISRVAVSHLETDLNTPGERTVAMLAGLFRMEPHELVAGTSYPVAKQDRLPLVVPRWTDAEHQLALFRRDLWWIDQLSAGSQAGEAEGDTSRHLWSSAEQVLDQWDQRLAQMAAGAVDGSEADELEMARRDLADLRLDLRRQPR
jgi:transcriptional regulator with XRE-family HTH domain